MVNSLTPFDSDELLADPQEIADLPGSLWSLTETDGLIISGEVDEPDSVAAVAKFAVTAPPVLRGDCNLDGDVNFLDIPPFIALFAEGGRLLAGGRHH